MSRPSPPDARGRARSGCAAILALAGLAAAGCARPSRPAHTARTAQPAPPEQPARAARPGPAATPASRPRPRGVPHAAPIRAARVSPGGTAAISIDEAGAARLWSRLDGSAEPWPVPVRDPVQASVAARPGGWAVGIVREDGAAVVVIVGESGDIVSRHAAADAAAAVHVLPGRARALVLGRDGAVRLVSDAGDTLAVARTGSLRAGRLELGRTGARAIAVGGGDGATRLRPVRVTGDSLAIGETVSAGGASPPGPASSVALSPEGGRVAYLAPDADARRWTARVLDLDAGAARAFPLPDAVDEPAELGFVGEDTLVVAVGDRARRVELERGAVVGHPAPASHLGRRGGHGFGPGRWITGLGTWLWSQDTRAGRSSYLGYAAFQPVSAALSASGDRAAWVTSVGVVYVETLGGGADRVTRVPSPSSTPLLRARFAGDGHLVVQDSVSGLYLIDWRRGRVVARADGGGPARDVEIAPGLGLVRVVRHGGETWVYRLTGGDDRAPGFAGPYVVAGGDHPSWLVASERGPALAIVVEGALRAWPVAELARGVDLRAIDGPPGPQPIAVDRLGRRYAARREAGATVVRVIGEDGGAISSFQVPGARLAALVPAPDGSAAAAVLRGGELVVVDVATGAARWRRENDAGVADLAWAPEGGRLAVATALGAAVLDGRSGRPVHITCGPWFEARETPPPSTFTGGRRRRRCRP